jgi:hypothetical protein
LTSRFDEPSRSEIHVPARCVANCCGQNKMTLLGHVTTSGQCRTAAFPRRPRVEMAAQHSENKGLEPPEGRALGTRSAGGPRRASA